MFKFVRTFNFSTVLCSLESSFLPRLNAQFSTPTIKKNLYNI
jgi:hypothetical protein